MTVFRERGRLGLLTGSDGQQGTTGERTPSPYVCTRGRSVRPRSRGHPGTSVSLDKRAWKESSLANNPQKYSKKRRFAVGKILDSGIQCLLHFCY